jgi:hypothetical protein
MTTYAAILSTSFRTQILTVLGDKYANKSFSLRRQLDGSFEVTTMPDVFARALGYLKRSLSLFRSACVQFSYFDNIIPDVFSSNRFLLS